MIFKSLFKGVLSRLAGILNFVFGCVYQVKLYLEQKCRNVAVGIKALNIPTFQTSTNIAKGIHVSGLSFDHTF